MLGVLHKVALGIAPPQMAALFPLRGVVDDPWQRRRLRSWRPLHNRQLHSHADISCTERMRLSLFGLVRSYNMLPQKAVDFKTVKSFQRCLQNSLKKYASTTDGEDWQRFFTDGWRLLPRAALDTFFA